MGTMRGRYALSGAFLFLACSGDTFAPSGTAGSGGNAGAAGSFGVGAGAASGGGGAGVSGGASAGSGATGGDGGMGNAPPGGGGGTTGGGGNVASGGGSAGASGTGGASGSAGGTGNAGATGDAGAAGNAGQSGKAGQGGGAGTAGASGAAGKGGGAGQGGLAGQGGSGPTGPFTPSNAAVVGGFATSEGRTGVFEGEFDTGENCKSGSKLGDCSQLPAPKNGAPPLCVCRFPGSLTVKGGTLTGTRALVLLVSDEANVTGSVRILSGDPHPAASSYAPPAGGSFAALGGNPVSGAPKNSEVRGTPDLVPLLTGQSGSLGGFSVPGGRGGGALQISAGVSLVISGGGLLDAGGEPGQASALGGGGPGGGSGGGILVEALELTLKGSIVANGASGSGGGADTVGGAGQKGTTNATPAPGGVAGLVTCDPSPPVVARFGGPGGSLEAPGASTGLAVAIKCASDGRVVQPGSGGGGGSVGRIALRAKIQPSFTSAVISPAPSFSPIP